MKCRLASCPTVSTFLFAFSLFLCVPALEAQTNPSRHHEAHEHGVAHLNVAVDGADLYLEFTSPAANIVGFEHPPRTDEQKTTVKKAIDTLKDGEALIVLPSGSQGRLAKSTVESDIDGGSGAESEAAHHYEGDEDDEHHGHHEKQAEVDGHKSHSEFHAEYHFVCEHPEKLAHVDVMLLDAFPGIEHIEVQLLTGTKQTGLELTAKKSRLPF